MRRVRVLASTVVLAGLIGLVGLSDVRADDAEAVLRRARDATVREDFSGVVEIEWRADGEWHSARAPVTGTGGTVQVGEGTRAAEGRGDRRWIAGVSGWQAGWDEPVRTAVPSPSAHWKLALGGGSDIAGRSTVVVTATDRDSGRPRLKVYCDRATGVMLRREVLDRRGEPVRAVGFVQVKKLGGTRSPPPANPTTGSDRGRGDSTPDRVGGIPDGYAAPPTVAGGFHLAGRYVRDDDIVQLYYSDGLFGVSVFQQRGDLDWNGLPRGGDVARVGDTNGRGYAAAGGTVLVWEHDGVTRTVVSDGTVADLRDFATAFDDRSGSDDSLLEDVTDFVLGPFGFR